MNAKTVQDGTLLKQSMQAVILHDDVNSAAKASALLENAGHQRISSRFIVVLSKTLKAFMPMDVIKLNQVNSRPQVLLAGNQTIRV
jgi:hypothetical protein